MGVLIRVTAAMVLLLSCAACGELRDSHYDWGGGKYIEQYFLGGEPYDFSGPDAGDAGLREAAADLLTNRRVNFVRNSLDATSWISHSHLLMQESGRVVSTSNYLGTVVYGVPDDPGVLIFHFDSGFASTPVETTIRYVFDQAATYAMFDDVQAWDGRVGEYYQSEDVQTVEATLRGEQDGEPWELCCRQDFACMAYVGEVI